jgi:hypothetical protein
MKLAGALSLVLLGCLAGACAPTQRAKAPTPDVFATMDKELANAISTTTLTSDVIELPSERLSLAEWEDDAEEEAPPLQTWATPAREKNDPGARP